MNGRTKRAALLVAGLCCAGSMFAAGLDVDKMVPARYDNMKVSSAANGAQTEWGVWNCHDPKIFQDDDGTYYVYSTDAAVGGAGQKGLQIRKSTDLVSWQSITPSALQKKWDRNWLKWVNFNNANASTWAPTVIKQNGLYYMMHGIITDVNNSGYPVAAITLAISASPTGPFIPAGSAGKDKVLGPKLKELGVTYKQSNIVRYTYNDRTWDSEDPSIADYYCWNTAMWDTQHGFEGDFASMSLGFGCIDPEFVMDVGSGKLMEYDVKGRACYGLTYGSWKGGIALMYVDKVSLKPVNPADGAVLDDPADTVEGAFGVAIGGGYGAAYEGAQVIFNSDTGYYYLFVSMGSLDWDYRVGVGRSKTVEGPYLDASGKSMLLSPLVASEYHEIGSKIIGSHVLKGEYSFRCQGGQSILRTQDGKIVFANHARTNYMPGYFFCLQVHQMFFTKDGWPVLNQNDYYADKTFAEKLGAVKASDIAGTYDTILTVRKADVGNYKPHGQNDPVEVCLADAIPTESKEITLGADGSVSGAYSGKWTLADDGSLTITLNGGGTFTGYALPAVAWARTKGNDRKTVTFTTIDGTKTGEYFWGNKRP